MSDMEALRPLEELALVARMGGPSGPTEHVAAFQNWLDQATRQP